MLSLLSRHGRATPLVWLTVDKAALKTVYHVPNSPPLPGAGSSLAAHCASIPEWQHIIDDPLDLSVVEVEHDGRRAILRTAPRPSINLVRNAATILPVRRAWLM